MAKAIAITGEWTASELRRLAAASKHANQSRRMLSLAAVLDGMNRTEAARIGGMDRQTLRDWVHRFNERGPEGLKDDLARDKPRRLTAAQQAELAAIVETGPEHAVDGVVRWRRIDQKALVAERFGVEGPLLSITHSARCAIAASVASERDGKPSRTTAFPLARSDSPRDDGVKVRSSSRSAGGILPYSLTLTELCQLALVDPTTWAGTLLGGGGGGAAGPVPERTDRADALLGLLHFRWWGLPRRVVSDARLRARSRATRPTLTPIDT
jgi:transposase